MLPVTEQTKGPGPNRQAHTLKIASPLEHYPDLIGEMGWYCTDYGTWLAMRTWLREHADILAAP